MVESVISINLKRRKDNFVRFFSFILLSLDLLLNIEQYRMSDFNPHYIENVPLQAWFPSDCFYKYERVKIGRKWLHVTFRHRPNTKY